MKSKDTKRLIRVYKKTLSEQTANIMIEHLILRNKSFLKK